MLSQIEKRIIEKISKMSGKYNQTQIFTDWVAIMAITFDERQKDAKELFCKYDKDEIKNFSELTGMLLLELSNKITDVLGSVYMEIFNSKQLLGQFFTPYHITYMIAKQMVDIEKEEIVMNEPSCGSGAMIIASAQVLKEAGKNYQEVLKVYATDLDIVSVHMTFSQLSILGIDAAVVCKNSLCDSVLRENSYFTYVKRLNAWKQRKYS